MSQSQLPESREGGEHEYWMNSTGKAIDREKKCMYPAVAASDGCLLEWTTVDTLCAGTCTGKFFMTTYLECSKCKRGAREDSQED